MVASISAADGGGTAAGKALLKQAHGIAILTSVSHPNIIQVQNTASYLAAIVLNIVCFASVARVNVRQLITGAIIQASK